MKRLLLIGLLTNAPLHSAAATPSIVIVPVKSSSKLGPISNNILAQTALALVLQKRTLKTLPSEPFIAPCDAGVTLSIVPHGAFELLITASTRGFAQNLHPHHPFTSLKTDIYDAIIATRPGSGIYSYGIDNGPADKNIFVDGNSKVLEFGIRRDMPTWYATVRTHVYRMQLQEAFNNDIKRLSPDLMQDESKDDSKRSVPRGLTPPSASALPTPIATATPLATPSASPAPPV